MVGRAGASKDAPVSVRPVVPTLSGSTTREIGTSGGGRICYSLEVALWLQPSPRHTCYSPYLSVPPQISPCSRNTAKTLLNHLLNVTIQC
ncbi:ash family protein [Klebsiella huaxiensis]|uniref:ash family protein n=1 Tax=Klebsiella huaxiensis TaxID=2153354 RepID=UPI0039C22579